MTARRLRIWRTYHDAFSQMGLPGWVGLPRVPEACKHNGHVYYLLLKDFDTRREVIEQLKTKGISAVFHYVPLHDSPGGKRYGRTVGTMSVTENVSQRLLRLPVWLGVEEHQAEIIRLVAESIGLCSCAEARSVGV